MKEQAISLFQMEGYKILNFSYDYPHFDSISVKSLKHDLHASISSIEFLENEWNAILDTHYTVTAGVSKTPFSLDVRAAALFTYKAANEEEAKNTFIKTLRMNGMVTMLSLLRGHVAIATTALGMQPSFSVPSIDLTKFEWDR